MNLLLAVVLWVPSGRAKNKGTGWSGYVSALSKSIVFPLLQSELEAFLAHFGWLQ